MAVAIQPLNPSQVMLHDNGRRLTQPERLKLIKGGFPGVSNTAIDRFVVNREFSEAHDKFVKNSELFKQLPQDVQAKLRSEWVSVSTLLAKARDGERLGDKIVFADKECSVTLMVYKPFRKENGMGIELTRDNFDLKLSADGKHATINLNEKDVTILELVKSCTLGQANDSTLWIPAAKVFDGKPSDGRYFNAPADAAVGLLARVHYVGYVIRQSVYLYRVPSFRSGVLGIRTGAQAPAAEKPAVTGLDAKALLAEIGRVEQQVQGAVTGAFAQLRKIIENAQKQ